MVQETHVLVVEDDEQTRELLAGVLSEGGYRVSVAAERGTALALLAREPVDVVLSDLRLGEESGLALLADVRALALPPKVILLTGYPSLETSISALRTGAFDYLRKPVAIDELLETIGRAARQHSHERRRAAAIRLLAADLGREVAGSQPGSPVEEVQPLSRGRYQQVGRIEVDFFRRTVSLDGVQIHLTPIEYALISCLAETPGRVISSNDLVERTHGYAAPLDEAQALLRGHVRNLRRKIPEGYIVTARGSGYMLIAPEG